MYFCERLKKDYSELFELITFEDIIEAHKVFKDTYSKEYSNSNIIYYIVKFASYHKDNFNSIQLNMITKVISEDVSIIKGIDKEFLSFYSILPPELKIDLLPFYFKNRLEEAKDLLSNVRFLENSVDKNKYLSNLIKSIISCDYEDLLNIFDELSLNESIGSIVEVKRAVIYYNLSKLKSCPIEQITALVDSSYHEEITNHLNKLNNEIFEIKQKLTSLWTNEFVDASNSSLSSYMIIEDISTPKMLLENISCPGRFVIGAGFGCFLTIKGELVIVNLENNEILKVYVGNTCIYPVLLGEKVFVANNEELTIFNNKGEIIDINLLEENVISLKATDSCVYCLTKNGVLSLYGGDIKSKEYTLDIGKSNITNDLVILEDYIVISTKENLMIYQWNNDEVVLVKEYPIEEVLKIVGVKNTIYIFEKRSIKQLNINNHILKEYKPLGVFDENKIVVESESSVVITFENKLVRIDFSTTVPVQTIITELAMSRKVTDIINCDGNFAIIIDDKMFAKVIKKESIFETSAEYELDITSHNYMLSSGYGNLYLSSSNALYQINNDEELAIVKEGDENVA